MKSLGWGGWNGGIRGWLIIAVLGGGGACGPLAAQVATTTVQDTVTDAGGAGAAGTVVVSWEAFTTAAGSSVAAGSLSSTLGAGGALSVALQPNAGATPMGSYYTAVFRLSDGTTSREFWVVPLTATGSVTLASIRNQVLPTTVAMQTVSKQYVDTTVAKAMAGVGPGGSLPYLLKGGDAMTGALTLAGDPSSALQAADKHYVDAAVAGVSGGGGSPSGTAGGDLSGSYPNPGVTAVHATSGTLNGVAIGAANPSAGAFTTLSSSGIITESAAGASQISMGLMGLYQASLANGQYAAVVLGRSATPQQAAGLFFIPNASNATTCVNLAVYGVQGLKTCGDDSATILGIFTASSFHETLATPASSSAACSAGDFMDDANFHYVCVAASSWKRVALAAF